MLTKARNDGEKRLLWFWMSETYAHEERWADAIKSIEEEKKIADASGDLVSASQDVNFIGNLLLGAGKPAEAAQKFEESLKLVDRSKASDAVKEAAHRNHLFDMGRVAVLKGDLATARATATKYAAAVDAKKVPFELRQAHELAGLVAVHAKEWDAALAELGKAGTQNPRVTYLTGLGLAGQGRPGEGRGGLPGGGRLQPAQRRVRLRPAPGAAPARPELTATGPRAGVMSSGAGRLPGSGSLAQPFSIGAPMRLPYSVQLPS